MNRGGIRLKSRIQRPIVVDEVDGHTSEMEQGVNEIDDTDDVASIKMPSKVQKDAKKFLQVSTTLEIQRLDALTTDKSEGQTSNKIPRNLWYNQQDGVAGAWRGAASTKYQRSLLYTGLSGGSFAPHKRGRDPEGCFMRHG